jgi:hypothetical protein
LTCAAPQNPNQPRLPYIAAHASVIAQHFRRWPNFFFFFFEQAVLLALLVLAVLLAVFTREQKM